MKRFLKLMMMAIVFTLPTMFVACDDDDEKENNGGNDSPEEFVTVKRIKQIRCQWTDKGYEEDEEKEITDLYKLNYDEKGRISSFYLSGEEEGIILSVSYEYPDSVIITEPFAGRYGHEFHCHIDENNRIDVYYECDLGDGDIDTLELVYTEDAYLIGENDGRDFAEYEDGNLVKCGINDIEYSYSYFST
ncbi:MAG: hypothetical protein ILP24_03965, partial [Paludibacteraceae bacterium]|nr:hypothetical protein [Paludibacteraceae bacterium]